MDNMEVIIEEIEMQEVAELTLEIFGIEVCSC